MNIDQPTAIAIVVVMCLWLSIAPLGWAASHLLLWLDRRNDEQPDATEAACIDAWDTIPRDFQGRELPDFDALFASITARIDEEGTA